VKSGWRTFVRRGLVLGGVLLPLHVNAEPRICADRSCQSDGRAPGPRVLLKHGPCRVGFYGSGNYCISYGAGRAISKSGPCPVGTFPSARYCVAYD
jgi:hypothetical protein